MGNMKYVLTGPSHGRTRVLGRRFQFVNGVCSLDIDDPEALLNITKVMASSYQAYPEHEVCKGMHGVVPGFFEEATQAAGTSPTPAATPPSSPSPAPASAPAEAGGGHGGTTTSGGRKPK